ncbi:hypothetical protein IAT38_008348 [Cryptococcus sp. DSM 104549]
MDEMGMSICIVIPRSRQGGLVDLWAPTAPKSSLLGQHPTSLLSNPQPTHLQFNDWFTGTLYTATHKGTITIQTPPGHPTLVLKDVLYTPGLPENRLSAYAARLNGSLRGPPPHCLVYMGIPDGQPWFVAGGTGLGYIRYRFNMTQAEGGGSGREPEYVATSWENVPDEDEVDAGELNEIVMPAYLRHGNA